TSSSTPLSLTLTFSPEVMSAVSSSSDQSWSTSTVLRLGMSSSCWPRRAEPDSTLPSTTGPRTLYLSTAGMRKGPSELRPRGARPSMYSRKGGPRYQGHTSGGATS
ncbi:unnamed protein product, partial [Ixodes pacificus]